MSKAKRAAAAPDPAAIEKLVLAALIKAAEAPGEVKLSGQPTDGVTSLFPSAAGANKPALERAMKGEPPLLRVMRKEGKAEFVQLTRAGFEHVRAHIAPERIGVIVRPIAGELQPAERAEFLNEIISRTPDAAPELVEELRLAVEAEKAELEARVRETTRRREREERINRALEQARQVMEQLRVARVDTLRKQLAAEGEADIPKEPIHGREKTPADARMSRQPEAREDSTFRRDVAGRLVSTWLESYRLNKPEGRLFLETAMGNISGLRQIGEEGERVAFDGKYHDSDAGAVTGSLVRVVRPGWVLEEDDGEYRLVSAKVST